MTSRALFAGSAASLALVSVGIALMVWSLPTETVAGPLARVLDAYVPWLLAVGLILGGLTLLLGARRLGALVIVAALGSSVAPTLAYRDVTRASDPARAPDLTVLFFNAFAGNSANGAEIVAQAVASGADILIFTEAEALETRLDDLRAQYSFVSPCPDDGCELILATNLPVIRFWRLQLNPAWPARYAVADIEVPGHGPVFLAATHLAKPWMSGIAEPELARVAAQMNWLTGPSVVVGDFNMPPWSQPMRSLLEETGFRALRFGPGTWPTGAPGLLRMPIDHVLVRDDLTISSVEAFGQGLGSNHLGVVARIALP